MAGRRPLAESCGGLDPAGLFGPLIEYPDMTLLAIFRCRMIDLLESLC